MDISSAVSAALCPFTEQNWHLFRHLSPAFFMFKRPCEGVKGLFRLDLVSAWVCICPEL